MFTAIHRRVAVLLVAVFCCGVLAVSAGARQPSQKPPDFKDYVPASQLPPSEQFPAARLLIAAYSVVLVGLFLYVASVARRLSTVQREVERLEADVRRPGRS